MRLAIQTLLLPGDSLSDKFNAAARYGFDAVEIATGPAFDVVANVADAKDAMAESGLPVCAICTQHMHDPLLPNPDERAARFAGLRNLIQCADELGAEGVVSVPVRPPYTYSGLTDRDRELTEIAVDAYRQWAVDLPPGGARVFLEPLNRYEAFFLNRVEQAVALARRIDHPRVVALADLFHMNIEEADMAEPLTAAGAYLGHVHIADNNRFQPGAGRLDFQTPFRVLKAMGYDGYLTIECFNARGPILGDPEEALPISIQFLRDQWDAA